MLDQIALDDPDPLLQRHGARRDDRQGDGAAAVHPADGLGIDSLRHMGHGAERDDAAASGIQRQVLQVGRRPDRARARIQKHIDLAIVLEIFIDKGPVGIGPDGIAQLIGVDAEFGRAFPVGADFDHRLTERERGRLGPHPRLDEDLLGPQKGREPQRVELLQIGAADIEVDAARAARIAGKDTAARDEAEHARKLPGIVLAQRDQPVQVSPLGHFHHIKGV